MPRPHEHKSDDGHNNNANQPAAAPATEAPARPHEALSANQARSHSPSETHAALSLIYLPDLLVETVGPMQNIAININHHGYRRGPIFGGDFQKPALIDP